MRTATGRAPNGWRRRPASDLASGLPDGLAHTRPAAPQVSGAEATPNRPIPTAMGRGTWVLIDQALSSASNFGVTVLVARSVSIGEFGTFGLVFAIGTLAMGVTRGAITQPLAIRFATRRAIDQSASALGATLIVAMPICLALGVASFGSGPQNQGSLLVFAMVLPLVLVQDTFRFVFIANGTPRQAALNDLIWCLVQTILLTVVVLSFEPTTPNFIVAWGVSGAVAAIFGGWQARALPAPRRGVTFLRRHADLGIRFAAEFLFQAGATQITILILALQVGTEGVGAVRGAQALLGIYFTVFMGGVIAATPEAARLIATRRAALPRALALLSFGLAILAVAFGGLLLLLPHSVGEQLLGDTWQQARSLIAGTTAGMAAVGAGAGGFIGMRVLEDAKANLRVRVISGVLTIALGVMGAVVAQAEGAVWALAIGQASAGVGAWVAFLRRFRTPVLGAGTDGDVRSLWRQLA